MRQVLQDLSTGQLSLEETPCPPCPRNGVLIRTTASVVSPGTEGALLRLARKSLVGKARERPDLVRKVLAKFRREGLAATLASVRGKLERAIPLGYSCSGAVLQVGDRSSPFRTGALVACAGAGHANHAEFNAVPRLLTVPVPANVSPDQAAYATIGAIALHGVRLSRATVGETVGVIGLGLIGHLAVQILRASGCRVIGLDPNPWRRSLAGEHGASLCLSSSDRDVKRRVSEATVGRGLDAVIVAAASKSSGPIEQAASLARDRARVIVIGATGLELPRAGFYEKELSLTVSRSYGPGRYDAGYEEDGNDYPLGYVRWTEQRNLEAFLELVASGAVRPEVCTTHSFAFADVLQAYELVAEPRAQQLGILLRYPDPEPGSSIRQASSVPLVTRPPKLTTSGEVGVSFLGCGQFARSTLLPSLPRNQTRLIGLCTRTPTSCHYFGRKFGFEFCTTTVDEVVSDPRCSLVVVATSHTSHSALAVLAMEAGKAVFVEKPLAISVGQLKAVYDSWKATSAWLMVGFNRRFSPWMEAVKGFVGQRGPISIQASCSAGELPEDHWLADPAEGGRVVGEIGHFVDVARFAIGSPLVRVSAVPVGNDDGKSSVSVRCLYQNGSTSTIDYISGSSAVLGKERVQFFCSGRTAVIDDFRRLFLADSQASKRVPSGRGDKGHAIELRRSVESLLDGREAPIPPEELFEASLATLAIEKSIAEGREVPMSEMWLMLRGDAQADRGTT